MGGRQTVNGMSIAYHQAQNQDTQMAANRRRINQIICHRIPPDPVLSVDLPEPSPEAILGFEPGMGLGLG